MTEFESNQLYHIICGNKVDEFNQFKATPSANFRLLSRDAETYLHIAVEKQSHLDIIKELIPRVRLGQRNVNMKTAFELANENQDQNSFMISKFHQDYILECIKDGKYEAIKELAFDGWAHWPVKGIPEIEEFSEAPRYLSGSQGNLVYDIKGPSIFSRKQVKELIEEEDIKNVSKNRDVLGMTVLHNAVIYRDEQLVSALLKTADLAKDMLLAQDNMGRTPIHYAFSFSEGSLVRDHIESFSMKSPYLLEITDYNGFTPIDYAKKKAKIDIKKLTNLYIFLMKCYDSNNFLKSLLLRDGEFDDSFFPDSEEGLKKFSYNCKDEPFTDATGRNLLHKAVILTPEEDCLEVINELLKLDSRCGNKLYKGQDLWGRTALHYAYMFDRPAMNILLKKRSSLSPKVINEVKKIKDHDGKTIDDYHMAKKDAAKLRKNLRKSMMLISSMGIMQYGQHLLMTVLLQAVNRKDDKSKEEINYGELLSLFESKHGRQALQLCVNAKSATGVPLSHYVLALQVTELITELPNIWSPEHEDHLGRNYFHYYRPDEDKMGDDLEEQFEINDFSDSEFDDSDDDDDDDGDDNNCDNDHKKDHHPTIKTNISDLLQKKDLQGNTPLDYKQKRCSFMDKDFIIKCIKKIVNKQSMTTLVTVERSPKVVIHDTVNTHDQNKPPLQRNNKPSPVLNGARLSATKRPSVSQTSTAVIDNSPPFDTEYLKNELGATLSNGLGLISLVQPADPIEFLAHFLYKHAENVNYQKQKQEEEKQLAVEMVADCIEQRKKEKMDEEIRLIREKQKAMEKTSDKVILEEQGE